MTHEFLVLIDVHDIKLFKLFAHSTHFTQSLNVEVFQSYKQTHENVIDKIIRNDDSKFTRLKFLIALTLFRFFAFIRETIRNVWRRTDIYSFNFEVVLNLIRNRIFERANAEVARSSTFSMQNFESLNRTPRKSTTMRKTFRFLNHFHQKHEFYNINSSHMRRFVKITRRLIHSFELHTRDFDSALKTIAKRKKRANFRKYKTFTFEIIKAEKCKFMYITKKTKNKKIEKRKTQREFAKKQKKQSEKQSEKQNEKNDENLENVEIVVIETLNINDVKKMKYVNFYSSVLEASEASVQNSNIDEKKSEKREKKFENEKKKFQFLEKVVRFNALIATTSYVDSWDINTYIELLKSSSFNKK